MLVRLTIQNYILIRKLEIEFGDGFSVITGETGSGKSILLGALSLILGQRADAGTLLNQAEKCVIEGTFQIAGYEMEKMLLNHDLDPDDQLIIRREISPTGKSRAFINDTPVGLNILKLFGDRLVNIHSQHAVLSINDAGFQLAVLDNYAGTRKEIVDYRKLFHAYTDLKEQREILSGHAANMAAEQDYFRFLFDELQATALIPGELPELEQRQAILQNAEEIKASLLHAASILEADDINVLTLLSEAEKSLGSVSKFNQRFPLLIERIHSNYIDIKDILSEITVIEEQTEINPGETERVNQRIDQIYRLLKKHQRKSTDELLEIKTELEQKLTQSENIYEKIAAIDKEIAERKVVLEKLANELSVRRQQAIPGFERDMSGLLSRLGMPAAQFAVSLRKSEDISRDGVDLVNYKFTANRGSGLKDLSHTASGGELSRLMLAIKSMISQKNLLPTIIFDEIDNGVSGEIAGKVGAILKSMGNQMQVIAITHLPQIAGMGTSHYGVYKSEKGMITESIITKLSEDQRIEEIAKMLSNEIVTDSAKKTALELLGNGSNLFNN
jgi:DNA repair protein RecN (Recombination protein N)